MLFRRLMLSATLALAAGSAAAQSNDPSFNLVNRSGQTIMEAYASPSRDTNWGVDRLGRDVLQNGQSYAIRLPAGDCIYDVRVVYQDRRAEERRNLNTCALTDLVFTGQAAAAPTPPGQQAPPAPRPGQAGPQGNPSFNLVNNTGFLVREVFASPSSDSNWGVNRLGTATVPTGQNAPVRLPQGECIYDVRVVLDGSAPIERRNVNLCDVTNLTFP